MLMSKLESFYWLESITWLKWSIWGFDRFPWQFPCHFRDTIPISDRFYSTRMIQILENHEMWKGDLYRNILNLSKTSWNRILALTLNLFDPLTLWESNKILFESLGARNYVDLENSKILILTISVQRIILFSKLQSQVEACLKTKQFRMKFSRKGNISLALSWIG